ncbi:MAG TPA: DUF4388 domain-containing protein [bacterium]|nr:DUF4388 domain-containing protein [bacterium]
MNRQVWGDLEVMSLHRLIQAMCDEPGDWEITLDSGPRTGRLQIQDGALVFAENHDRFGADAVHRLLRWKRGRFRVQSSDHRESANITTSWKMILVDGLRRVDETVREGDPVEVTRRKLWEIGFALDEFQGYLSAGWRDLDFYIHDQDIHAMVNHSDRDLEDVLMASLAQPLELNRCEPFQSNPNPVAAADLSQLIYQVYCEAIHSLTEMYPSLTGVSILDMDMVSWCQTGDVSVIRDKTAADRRSDAWRRAADQGARGAFIKHREGIHHLQRIPGTEMTVEAAFSDSRELGLARISIHRDVPRLIRRQLTVSIDNFLQALNRGRDNERKA